MPLTHWHTKEAYSIGENKDLIQYVKNKIELKNIDISLHGIHHTYRFKGHTMVPELIDEIDNFDRS